MLVINSFAGLGRAFAEVGAVMIVGGNIAYETRMLTNINCITETSRGDLVTAMALGLILIILSITVSLLINIIRNKSIN